MLFVPSEKQKDCGKFAPSNTKFQKNVSVVKLCEETMGGGVGVGGMCVCDVGWGMGEAGGNKPNSLDTTVKSLRLCLCC